MLPAVQVLKWNQAMCKQITDFYPEITLQVQISLCLQMEKRVKCYREVAGMSDTAFVDAWQAILKLQPMTDRQFNELVTKTGLDPSQARKWRENFTKINVSQLPPMENRYDVVLGLLRKVRESSEEKLAELQK